MIQSIYLENFQCHKNLTVEFGPITTLVGPNSAGKTAVVRAIRWLATNQPSGMNLVRRKSLETNSSPTDSTSSLPSSKAKESRAASSLPTSYTCRVHCRVSVSHPSSTEGESALIQRVRSKNENLYQLDEQEYRAFGTGVPQDIEAILNIHPCSFGGQLDAPFWLGLSGADLSRELNQIVDLDIIDRVTTVTSQKLRKLKSEHDVLARMVQATEEELATLTWVEEAEADLAQLDKRELQNQERAAAIVQLRNLVSEYETSQNLHASYVDPLEDFRHLQSFQKVYDDGLTHLRTLQELIPKAEPVGAIELGELAALEKQAARVQTLDTERKEIQRQLEISESCDRGIAHTTEELEQLRALLQKVGKRCPTCQQPLPSSSPIST